MLKKIISLLKKSFKNKHNPNNPYQNLTYLKNIEVLLFDKDFHGGENIKFSLITTVKNEEKNILNFLSSFNNQTLKPDEIVIVDGGSTDQTVDYIKNFNSSIKIRLIVEEGANISRGRNIAISQAKNELILCTDAGSVADNNFCRNQILPLAQYPDLDLSAGITFSLHKSYPDWVIPDYDNLDFNQFLPSGRAVSVKKSLLDKMGGFPEYLTLTGEDTLFAINYRRHSRKWAFNKKSFILWDSPQNDNEGHKLIFRYGYGDGESGVGDFVFHDQTMKFLQKQKIILTPTWLHFFEGYLQGRDKRPEIEFERRNCQGLVIIHSQLPLTRILRKKTSLYDKILEYISKNFKVIYLSPYVEKLDSRIYLDFDFTLLETYQYHDHAIKDIVTRYRNYLNNAIFYPEGERNVFFQKKKASP